MTASIRGVAWALDAGADPSDLAAAWSLGATADIPIGQTWDVVRIVRQLGYDVYLRVQDLALGPVLLTPPRDAVEFIVARGSAAAWPEIPGTRAVAAGVIKCPPPRVTLDSGACSTGARRWLVPPTDPVVTDATALCEQTAAALLHRIQAGSRTAGRQVVRR